MKGGTIQILFLMNGQTILFFGRIVNSKWYEGIADRQLSTNNDLKATNRVVKAENNLRKRLPVGQFLNGVGTISGKRCKDRVPEFFSCIPYAMSPSISLKMWTEAYQ